MPGTRRNTRAEPLSSLLSCPYIIDCVSATGPGQARARLEQPAFNLNHAIQIERGKLL
jgi:hypothetical protein